jgi:hypothetical protein
VATLVTDLYFLAITDDDTGKPTEVNLMNVTYITTDKKGKTLIYLTSGVEITVKESYDAVKALLPRKLGI